MKTIWKYRIDAPETDVKLHGKPVSFEGPQVLHTAFQVNDEDGPQANLFVWAMVDTEQPEATLKFRILPTGRSLRGMTAYRCVGSVIDPAHGEVLHVFVAGEA